MRLASSTRRSTHRCWTCGRRGLGGSAPAASRCHHRPLELSGGRRLRASGPACRRTHAISRGTPPTTTRSRRRSSTAVTPTSSSPRDRHNSKGWRQWWGVPDRTLEAVLEHTEDINTPRYEYPPPSSFSCRRDDSWTPRRMESTTSSLSGSRSRSSGSPALLPMKPEPQETPMGRHTCNIGIVINEPDASSFRLVRPKTEPGLLPVKQEHLAMAADDEATLKWARDDYVREEMERQRRTPEEIAARRCGCEDGVVVILDVSDEEAPAPVCLRDPGQCSSKDDALVGGNDKDNDDDYTTFYKLLGM
ncbi:hypothetical protein ZWY2020_042084 [Hordeum vulgare]|nr:hypothetical protein ZWY2020_042084 [Hordeum vulgare]